MFHNRVGSVHVLVGTGRQPSHGVPDSQLRLHERQQLRQIQVVERRDWRRELARSVVSNAPLTLAIIKVAGFKYSGITSLAIT